jgi:hypothetical protein
MFGDFVESTYLAHAFTSAISHGLSNIGGREEVVRGRRLRHGGYHRSRLLRLDALRTGNGSFGRRH